MLVAYSIILAVIYITILLVPLTFLGMVVWLCYLAWVKIKQASIKDAVERGPSQRAWRVVMWTVGCAYLLGVPAVAYGLPAVQRWGFVWSCELSLHDDEQVQVQFRAEWEPSWFPAQDTEWMPPIAAWVSFPSNLEDPNIYLGGQTLGSPPVITDYQPAVYSALGHTEVSDMDNASSLVGAAINGLMTRGFQGLEDHLEGRESIFGVAPAQPDVWQILSRDSYTTPPNRTVPVYAVYIFCGIIWISGVWFFIKRTKRANTSSVMPS